MGGPYGKRPNRPWSLCAEGQRPAARRGPGVNGKRADMQRISIGVVPPVFRSPAVFGAVREKKTGGSLFLRAVSRADIQVCPFGDCSRVFDFQREEKDWKIRLIAYFPIRICAEASQIP